MGFAMPWIQGLFEVYLLILSVGMLISFVAGMKGWLVCWAAGNIFLFGYILQWLGGLGAHILIYLFALALAYCLSYWTGKIKARGE